MVPAPAPAFAAGHACGLTGADATTLGASVVVPTVVISNNLTLSTANGGTNDTTVTATSAADSSVSATAKLTTIAVSVDTLIVDGDMGGPNVESYYQTALTANGVGHSYWDLSADPTLPLERPSRPLRGRLRAIRRCCKRSTR